MKKKIEPCTREKIFSIELCVASVTFNLSDMSVYRSPWIAKSKILYIRRWSHRPNLRSKPENTAFSLTLPLLSERMYSRHVAGVKMAGTRGFNEVVCSLFRWWPQSDCSKRNVRNTLEIVNASTEKIEKLRRRHGVCLTRERRNKKMKIFDMHAASVHSSPESFDDLFCWHYLVTSCSTWLLSFCHCYRMSCFGNSWKIQLLRGSFVSFF